MPMKSIPKLYQILGVAPEASTKEITKAFRIAALRTHPDKLGKLSAKERDEAKGHFLELQRAYEVLRDQERRRGYDLYGWEGEQSDAFQAAFHYYKTPVTQEDIESFAKTYKGSEAESQDLIDFYQRFDGKLDDILMFIPLSEAGDLDRFVAFFRGRGDLKPTKQFESSSTKSALAKIRNKFKKVEAKEAKQAKGESVDELAAKILANRNKRARDFGDLISKMETKYKKLKK